MPFWLPNSKFLLHMRRLSSATRLFLSFSFLAGATSVWLFFWYFPTQQGITDLIKQEEFLQQEKRDNAEKLARLEGAVAKIDRQAFTGLQNNEAVVCHQNQGMEGLVELISSFNLTCQKINSLQKTRHPASVSCSIVGAYYDFRRCLFAMQEKGFFGSSLKMNRLQDGNIEVVMNVRLSLS